MHLKRIVATLATAAAVVGTVSLGAGSASADAHPVVNTYINTWTSVEHMALGHLSAWDACKMLGQDRENQAAFGSPDPWNHGSEQYYYCADGGNGTANLWLRHYS